MARIAIVGGSGLSELPGMEQAQTLDLETPWGKPSSSISSGIISGHTVFFLARHGIPHRIPPHCINYRANMQAIASLKPDFVVAVAAVGGIAEFAAPTALVIPDQLIDYSTGRKHTYSDSSDVLLAHVDFTNPYDEDLRLSLLAAAVEIGIQCHDGGVYGVTQGPRLETAAEIRRMKADGCDLVGMTGMPEAGLARELGLVYANLSVVANWGAGLSDGEITMDAIEANLKKGMEAVRTVLYRWLSTLS